MKKKGGATAVKPNLKVAQQKNKKLEASFREPKNSSVQQSEMGKKESTVTPNKPGRGHKQSKSTNNALRDLLNHQRMFVQSMNIGSTNLLIKMNSRQKMRKLNF